MHNRLSVLMTVYNEADFVEYAIRACLPHVDDLVIVEGAYQETIACGAEPRSTDKTREIVDLLANIHMVEVGPPEGSNNPWASDASKWKMTYVEANEQTDKDQRNVGLRQIKELNPSGWLLIIDGDEVYTKENFMMVRNFMATMEKQDKYAAYFKSLTFVNDFEHFTEQEFPRLFRITPECEFVNDNFMQWPDKGLGWGYPHVIKLPYLRFHHYAFCKGAERFEMKKKWWETRFDQPFDYSWSADEDGKITDPGHNVQQYTGKHPEIMKDHPMWRQNET